MRRGVMSDDLPEYFPEPNPLDNPWHYVIIFVCILVPIAVLFFICLIFYEVRQKRDLIKFREREVARREAWVRRLSESARHSYTPKSHQPPSNTIELEEMIKAEEQKKSSRSSLDNL